MWIRKYLKAFALLVLLLCGNANAADWALPDITLPARKTGPLIACTPAELARLRAAYRGQSRKHDVLAGYVRRADSAMKGAIRFPPRGGQHNQWYQCEKCQLALKTVDETHHKCPKCDKVYRGEPYDDVIFSRIHGRNLSSMHAAAWAYALTGDEKYAAWAKKMLLGYAQRYRQYPFHSASRTKDSWSSRSGGHLYEQTLTEASAFTRSIAPAYDLVRHAGCISKAENETIRSGLILPMLRNIDKNKAGKSNWQTWHNAALLLGGALLGDVTWVRKAIADPRNGFVSQMQVSVTADGMWYENSWGYHYYTLGAMQEIVEGARRLGIDLWRHPMLKKMYTVGVGYAMSDGSLPRFGDDVQSRVSSASHYLEYAYHALKDPSLLPYLATRPTFQTIMFGRKVGAPIPKKPPASMLFKSAGHGILRMGGEAKLSAAMTFGPYGGFHGHFDKLSFVFFGLGHELGVDPGRARSQAYRLPIHRNWYKATISHNTVLVDGKSQKPASGRLLLFQSDERYTAVAAVCDQAYPGVVHKRLLCMTSDYLLVFDALSADRAQRFDWVYHNRGRAMTCRPSLSRPAAGAITFGGAEYVKDMSSGITDGPIHVVFEQSKVNTQLTLAAAPATQILSGWGVGASVLDRVPMVIMSRQGKDACFAALLQPVRAGDKALAKLAVVNVEGDGITLVVRGADRVDTMKLSRWKTLSCSSQGPR